MGPKPPDCQAHSVLDPHVEEGIDDLKHRDNAHLRRNRGEIRLRSYKLRRPRTVSSTTSPNTAGRGAYICVPSRRYTAEGEAFVGAAQSPNELPKKSSGKATCTLSRPVGVSTPRESNSLFEQSVVPSVTPAVQSGPTGDRRRPLRVRRAVSPAGARRYRRPSSRLRGRCPGWGTHARVGSRTSPADRPGRRIRAGSGARLLHRCPGRGPGS